ncbi:MarR family winged helix-turn-helix transcriptional regulator [Paraburkholderia tuberum]|uniref:MarR family winged helix-turn-helix transcriptional regulator n=1 Tax=Paraburkholderia tuberum TaxID=157910 RepID=UPI001FC81A79|nr:helix-turn-helix domain-containing protein [Paraburkholderia tuberum]
MSAFRYQLRRFLRYSEEITHAEGVTPLQYQMLLHVRGFPDRSWASIGELAERLQAAPNGTAALVSRCEAAGLVERRPDASDRRLVQVHLLRLPGLRRMGSRHLPQGVPAQRRERAIIIVPARGKPLSLL